MSSTQRKIATALILTTFLALAIFSFAGMTYGPDGRMQGDCPFSTAGTSLCSQGTLASVAHHISAYEAFINVPVGSGLTVLVLALIIAFSAVLLFSVRLFLPKLFVPLRYFYHSPPLALHTRKITRWLSLFENSPSLI